MDGIDWYAAITVREREREVFVRRVWCCFIFRLERVCNP